VVSALAHALREAGHEAVLAPPTLPVRLAEPYGVSFAPLSDDMNTGIEV
jgi:hypothetical protein